MIEKLLHRKWMLIVVALLIAGGTWYGLSASSPSADLITTPIAAAASPAEQGLVATLLTLRAVRLDGTILTDPVFMSLRDFSTQIVAEPVGRENPFAPLSTQTLSSSTSTQNAQIFTPR